MGFLAGGVGGGEAEGVPIFTGLPGFTGPSPCFHSFGTTPAWWHVLQTWVSTLPDPWQVGQAFSLAPGFRFFWNGTNGGAAINNHNHPHAMCPSASTITIRQASINNA
jgi:hypothetical protein